MILEKYGKIENDNIEFKEILENSKPKSWLKTISAFANCKGGIIIFGVRDNDKFLVGLKDVAFVSEKISEHINNRISPIPRYELNSFNENDKDYLELKIGDGPYTPYFYNGDGRKEAYIRSGEESIIAPDHVLKGLILKGKNITFDQISTTYSLNEVNFNVLNSCIKKETGSVINIDKDYFSLGLMDSENKITNAGLLLCDRGLLDQSHIFCTRWKGLVKGSVDGDALDDKEYTGSIISLLENSELFIKNNSKVGWDINGMKRIECPDYPKEAIREAIVNAIIHRDYQITGSEIHIDIFDNRLEIISPGGMIDGSLIQNLDVEKVPSIRRNKVISDVFNRLHFMERRGSGLTRIYESYANSKIKPSFVSNYLSFCVTLPNTKYIKNIKSQNKNTTSIGNVVSDDDYFIIKMYKVVGDKVRSSTLKQIKMIFKEYGYKYEFKKSDVEELLNVKKSRASEIIMMLIENKMVENTEILKYKFIK